MRKLGIVSLMSLGLTFASVPPPTQTPPQPQQMGVNSNMKPSTPLPSQQNQIHKQVQNNFSNQAQPQSGLNQSQAIPSPNKHSNDMDYQKRNNDYQSAKGYNPFLEKNFEKLLKTTIRNILKEYEKKIKTEYELKYVPQIEKMKLQLMRLQNQKLKLQIEKEKMKMELEKLKLKYKEALEKKKEEKEKIPAFIKVRSLIKVGNKTSLVLDDGTVLTEGSKIGKFYIKSIKKDKVILVNSEGKIVSIPIKLE
jgi:transposase